MSYGHDEGRRAIDAHEPVIAVLLRDFQARREKQQLELGPLGDAVRGYVGVTPGWPDDPDTVAQARKHPEVFAGKGITEIADYEEAIIRRLKRKPVIIGHSFGAC